MALTEKKWTFILGIFTNFTVDFILFFSIHCILECLCFKTKIVDDKRLKIKLKNTAKSLSEALLFAEHGENMLCTNIVLNVRNNFCTQHVLPRFELAIFMYWTCNSMNSLSSYCGLVDAKIRTSDKDLPVSFCYTLLF